MSKTANSEDKRARADLELFILALISRGLTTPYDLRTSAGLSPGATIPALGRLEKAGFVVKGKATARRRLEYELSQRGKKHLETSWRALLSPSQTADLDVVLRVASLALLMGEKRQAVAGFLVAASKDRQIQAKNARIAESPKLRDPGLYRWLRQFSGPTRTASEAAILRKMAALARRLWHRPVPMRISNQDGNPCPAMT